MDFFKTLVLFATLGTRGNWIELTFAKASGTFTRDREIADLLFLSNNPRNNCGKHIGSISFFVSIVENYS